MVKKNKDFQKVKLKIGRKVQRQTETIVNVKTRKISLPQTRIVPEASDNLSNILNQVVGSLHSSNVDDITTNLENIHDILNVLATSKSSLGALIGEEMGSFELGDLFGFLLRFSRTIQSEVIPHAIRKISILLIQIFAKEGLGSAHFANFFTLAHIMITRNEKVWISEGLRLMTFLTQTDQIMGLLDGLLTNYELYKSITRIFQYFDQLIDSNFNISCKLALIETSTRLLSYKKRDNRELGQWFSSYEELFESQTCLTDRLTALFQFNLAYGIRFVDEASKSCTLNNLIGVYWSIKGLNYLLSDYSHLIRLEKCDKMVCLAFKRLPLSQTDVIHANLDAEETNRMVFLVELINSEAFLLQNLFLSRLTKSKVEEMVEETELAVQRANETDVKESFLSKIIKFNSIEANQGSKKKTAHVSKTTNKWKNLFEKLEDMVECPKKRRVIADSWILVLKGVLNSAQELSKEQSRMFDIVLARLVSHLHDNVPTKRQGRMMREIVKSTATLSDSIKEERLVLYKTILDKIYGEPDSDEPGEHDEACIQNELLKINI